MNWLRAIEAQLPAAMMMLAPVTALLIAGLAAQHIVRRSPAARHAVLLWTLVAVGLCPILMTALRLAAIPAPFVVSKLVVSKLVVPINILFGNPGAAQTLPPTGAHDLSLAGILIAVWAVGALISLVALIRGLRMARQIRRGAQPIDAERIASARTLLVTVFGGNLPQLFTSDHVDVPMAVGYLHPVVLLPSSLIAKLNHQQLLQVLIHECAHALRRDALVALYQRTLAAVFWFHPLVHYASQVLDHVREEICDNYVLQTAPAKDYAQTLLTVAESLSQQPTQWFAPALIHSASLEGRIAGLLNSRRCIVTKLTSKKIAAIAICFIGSVIVLSCFAATPAAQQNATSDFSHVVNLAKTSTGDSITITEVRGPSDTLEVGKIYEVRGTYKLVSQDKALLSVGVTTERFQPGESHPGVTNESHPPLPRQKVIVEKGEGAFTLQFYMTHGQPHVSFYPLEDGSGFAGRNFGHAILYPGQ